VYCTSGRAARLTRFAPPPLQAARRATMVALLESRKAERGVAKEARRTHMEAATADFGQNVARSSDEFWVLFNAAAKGEC
jgi:hypothetical protein